MSQNQLFDPSQPGADSAAQFSAPTPTGPAVPVAQTTQAPASNGLAMSALITGLLGLLAVLVFFMTDLGGSLLTVGAVLGIVGFVLGIVALKKRQSKGMAVTGLVTGLISALLALAIFVFALIFIGALASAFM